MAFTDTADVMEMTGLPVTEWQVLLALAHFRNGKTGKCNPSLDTIAEYSHLVHSTVPAALRRLKDRNLIDWTKGSRHTSNSYILTFSEQLPETTPTIRAVAEQLPRTTVTSNQRVHVGSSASPRGMREGDHVLPRTVQYGTDSLPHASRGPLRGDQGDPGPQTSGALPPNPRRRDFSSPDPTVEDSLLTSPAARPHSASPQTPTLSAADAQTLTQLYSHLSGSEDLADTFQEFVQYNGPLSSSVIANCCLWAYRVSVGPKGYWAEHLEPTSADFLRALPAIHRQYEAFYVSRESGRKPHDLLDAQAILTKLFPPAPRQQSWDVDKGLVYADTGEPVPFIEGEVAMEPGDEVEMPKSRAFLIED